LRLRQQLLAVLEWPVAIVGGISELSALEPKVRRCSNLLMLVPSNTSSALLVAVLQFIFLHLVQQPATDRLIFCSFDFLGRLRDVVDGSNPVPLSCLCIMLNLCSVYCL
jgi:hypothetical protein